MIPETEELDVTGVKVTPSPPFEEFQGIVYLCGRALISGLKAAISSMVDYFKQSSLEFL